MDIFFGNQEPPEGPNLRLRSKLLTGNGFKAWEGVRLGGRDQFRRHNDTRPRVVRLAMPRFVDPGISCRARAADRSLHESRRECLHVSSRQNLAASCRSEKD